jgi:hypothetical protein
MRQLGNVNDERKAHAKTTRNCGSSIVANKDWERGIHMEKGQPENLAGVDGR